MSSYEIEQPGNVDPRTPEEAWGIPEADLLRAVNEAFEAELAARAGDSEVIYRTDPNEVARRARYFDYPFAGGGNVIEVMKAARKENK